MAKPKKTKAAPDDNAELFEDSITASDNDLKAISKSIEQALFLDGEKTALLEALKNVNDKINKLRGETLPSLMETAGVSQFTDDKNSMHVVVAPWLSCKWPGAEAGDNMLKDALGWLKENKAEDLLKCTVTAAFGRKEAAKARKFAKEIVKTGNATVKIEEGVHNQTLAKYIRDQLKANKKVPLDTFDVQTGKWADIKPAKAKN